MSPEEIMEGNRLIAKFMGLPKCRRYHDCGGFQYGSVLIFMPGEMQYFSSWDWLMPVIKKFDIKDDPFEMYLSMMDTDIQKTYQVVIKYIKQK